MYAFLLLFCGICFWVHISVSSCKAHVRSIWQWSCSNKNKGAGSCWEALPEACSAPKFAFQVNRPMPGWGCRSKAWFMAVPGLRVVHGKSSSTLKEAPLWGCLRLSQGRDLNGWTNPFLLWGQVAPSQLSQHGVGLWAVGLWEMHRWASWQEWDHSYH